MHAHYRGLSTLVVHPDQSAHRLILNKLTKIPPKVSSKVRKFTHISRVSWAQALPWRCSNSNARSTWSDVVYLQPRTSSASGGAMPLRQGAGRRPLGRYTAKCPKTSWWFLCFYLFIIRFYFFFFTMFRNYDITVHGMLLWHFHSFECNKNQCLDDLFLESYYCIM